MTKRRRAYLVAIGILSIAIGWAAARLVPKPLPEFSRQEFLAEARAGHIRSVVIADQEVITGESATRGPFRTRMQPRDTALLEELRSLGVEILYERPDPGVP